MQIIRSVAELRHAIAAARSAGKDVGLVPTMGALHEGHLSLVQAARRDCDRVIVTIFVNPIQFNDPFDLEKYPRTQDADLDLLAGIGADVVFAPRVEEMYPDGQPSVRIKAGPMGDVLEGAHRPGHFL